MISLKNSDFACVILWLQTKNPTIFNVICWVVGTNNSSTKHLMFQALIFFIISIDLGHSKFFIYVYEKSLKSKKINWNDFRKDFCKKLWRKNNSRNIRSLVHESFVPGTQRIMMRIVGFLVFLLDISWIIQIWPRIKFPLQKYFDPIGQQGFWH